jgi:DNA-directed RNA polymerase specialized sigma24 family protein
MFSFEDKIAVINSEIAKRKNKWKLKAIPSIDFDDVSQILRLHIYQKWHLWDQGRPFEPWLNTVITNQIRNLMRNLYGNFARPCLNCAANQGGDLCAIFGKQCSQCPLYAHWEKHKKSAHDTKLPVPIDVHQQEVYSIPEQSGDLVKQIQVLHIKMKTVLTPLQYKVYDLLFIQGKSSEEVAKLMGYKTNEKNRSPGYKQLPNMRKAIIEKAKKLIERDL